VGSCRNTGRVKESCAREKIRDIFPMCPPVLGFRANTGVLYSVHLH